MDIAKLRDRMDAVLDQLYSSRAPLSDQDELREEFIGIYETLLEQVVEAGETLNEDHAYFFTIPQHPIYRQLLDDDLLDILGTGALYTLPASEDCGPSELDELQEQLTNL